MSQKLILQVPTRIIMREMDIITAIVQRLNEKAGMEIPDISQGDFEGIAIDNENVKVSFNFITGMRVEINADYFVRVMAIYQKFLLATVDAGCIMYAATKELTESMEDLVMEDMPRKPHAYGGCCSCGVHDTVYDPFDDDSW